MGAISSLDIMTILFEYEDAKTGAAVSESQVGYIDWVWCPILMQIGSVHLYAISALILLTSSTAGLNENH